jgi:aryl sulfotransferase
MTKPEIPARRVYQGSVSDSTRWQAFRPRPGDVVVTTPPKAGTTWTQAILALLISGDPGVDAQTSMKSPWIDIKFRDLAEVMARLETQDHRRQVKSHTPFDGLPVWSDLRYIAVYRHPLDIHFSYRNHVANMKPDLERDLVPDDLDASFARFVESDSDDGGSLYSIVNHLRCTLALEPRDNLIRLHYADMQRDLPGTVARIAAHVDISHPPALMARLVAAATFDSMKTNAARFTPSAGQSFWKDDMNFFASGTSNKWQGRLSPAQLAAYDARLDELLGPEDRHWLEWGAG